MENREDIMVIKNTDFQYRCLIFQYNSTDFMNIVISTCSRLVGSHISRVSTATGSLYKGVAVSLLIEEAKRQMRGGVCHFVYMKADGSLREAFGTLDRGVLCATLEGTGISPECWGCCYYHDVIKGGARSFRWENLVAVLS